MVKSLVHTALAILGLLHSALHLIQNQELFATSAFRFSFKTTALQLSRPDVTPLIRYNTPEAACAFSCNSTQVQQSALDFYLKHFPEVHSTRLLNIVPAGPFNQTCDLLFKWTHRDDLGASSGEDFRKFQFQRFPDTGNCVFVPKAMGYHFTGSTALLDPQNDLRFETSGKCKSALVGREFEVSEADAKWYGQGIWPVCFPEDLGCKRDERSKHSW
ncbi:hypothetical protein KFL_002250210 [Klebsormidium nitens]|uniref:DUF7074 domain-containing protein n=1 Tax=Klebsormidium nitens TaxID=105231 RepID=A0A1Y1I7X0_KLENI|nr:hypothetical protein KFL_002250210 [Klebsormidium nitens]|eukprot:GAQ85241.1 hypothetical protein KFL_002250210 [Klebsormidium nitens]